MLQPIGPRLHDSPDNPCPADAIVEALTTRDGITLRTVRWPSLSPNPKGTVCLFQGRLSSSRNISR